ncbi:MAG: ABC transporter permease subunit [Oscillospiraceae bacterium]|nr:ABC transporter permease subunit [Oscillospiraceae bacterium]
MNHKESLGRTIKRQFSVHVFVWMGLIFLLIFSIIPLLGIVIAFKDYKITTGFAGMFTSPLVGLKHFSALLNDRKFIPLLENTLTISIMKLLLGFPLAVFFAIMIAEMRFMVFKRVVQTVSYLPHFISWVITAGVLFTFFSTQFGVVNEVLLKYNLISEPIKILMEPKSYYNLAVWSDIWKECGYSSIIFLAAIMGVDAALYESAAIDGAGRLRRIWHITLPSIQGAIGVVLILRVGRLMSGNFDQSMMLGNNMNLSRAEVFERFIFTTGLAEARYSFATAAGLFQSIIAFSLVLVTNMIARKYSEVSLFD